jgi:hypothetical protein
MSTDKPVVVHGASGYTGRLLRSFGLVIEPVLTTAH